MASRGPGQEPGPSAWAERQPARKWLDSHPASAGEGWRLQSAPLVFNLGRNTGLGFLNLSLSKTVYKKKKKFNT